MSNMGILKQLEGVLCIRQFLADLQKCGSPIHFINRAQELLIGFSLGWRLSPLITARQENMPLEKVLIILLVCEFTTC